MSEVLRKSSLSWEEWERVLCQLLVTYQGRPQFQVGLFDSTNVVIWRIIEGWANGEVEGREYHANSGEWLMHLPTPRLQRFSPDSQIFSIRFNLRWLSEAPLLRGRSPLVFRDDEMLPLFPVIEELLSFCIKTPERLWFDNTRKLSFVEMETFRRLVHEILGYCLSAGLDRGWEIVPEKEIDPRLRVVQQELQKWPLGKPMDKEELAESVHLGSAQVNRLFKATHGMTPLQYFDERRLDYARLSLLRGNKRVKEIAYELGFKTLSHFSIWFQKNTGSSPREFRETGSR